MSALLVGLTTPASGEPIRLALDIEQGVFVKPGTPYSFTAKLSPGLDVGRLRLGVLAGPTLVEPEWDLVLGIAPSFSFVAPVTSNTGLRIVGDGAYLARAGEFRATGGVVLDFDGFHIGEVAGYDWSARSALILTTLGVDLPRLIRFIGDKPF